MKFLLDHCISPKIIPILAMHAKKVGHEIKPMQAVLNPNHDDEDWMRKLGSQGDWAIVTKDPAITKVAHERAAWLDSKVTGFFLDGAGWGKWRWRIRSKNGLVPGSAEAYTSRRKSEQTAKMIASAKIVFSESPKTKERRL